MTVPAGVRLRVAAIADADSFVKWAGALVDALVDVDAFAGARADAARGQPRPGARRARRYLLPDAVRLGFDEVSGWLRRTRPDVVVLAGRGPFVRLIMTEIDRVEHRPVVVSGLPGISIPAQRGAVLYRRHADLVVVPLATRAACLPRASPEGSASMWSSPTLPYARADHRPGAGGTDLVFAAQAIVPREREDRQFMAGILRQPQPPDPIDGSRRRARREHGEEETHFERAAYTDLLRDPPANLIVSHAPMREALATAEGLVTVSSTSAIEAIAMGLPVIALDTFGVSKSNLNTVFTGSGLLGGAADVVARRFRHPSSTWREQNYFHDESASTWRKRVEELRSCVGTASFPLVPARGGALHRAWHRKSVLGAEDRTPSGSLALAVGTPAVATVLATRRFRGRRGANTWSDDASDITVTPARYQDPGSTADRAPPEGRVRHSHPLSAMRAASALFLPPVLPIALDRWLRTVPSLRCRMRAMSAIDPPVRAVDSTSVSRSVSGESPCASESAASAGSTTRSPRATRRTASASWAAGVSLTTKPDAPACIARLR